ncbi:MAG: hypothetical protein KA206_08130 [Paludibacter sp.]|nr:hypothetical protein [Paludibacter sp.]
MQTLVLNGESVSEIKLIAELAKKMGLTAKILSEEEREDIGMLKAIKSGRTKQYIDKENFLNQLRK